MLMATAAISILALLDERPSLEEILTWIDIETLTLLFAMMIMVPKYLILYFSALFNPSTIRSRYYRKLASSITLVFGLIR